ncbi:unnamed protein product [Rotaria socialis]
MDEFDAYADDLAYSKRASGISCTRQIDSSTCGRPIIAPKLTECIYGGSEEISHSWSWIDTHEVAAGTNNNIGTNSITDSMSAVKISDATEKVNIPANATWAQNGVTIAGGHREGDATNELNGPRGLFVDDDQTYKNQMRSF